MRGDGEMFTSGVEDNEQPRKVIELVGQLKPSSLEDLKSTPRVLANVDMTARALHKIVKFGAAKRTSST